MKTNTIVSSVILLSMFVTGSASAHDPKMHADKSKKIDCSSINDIDHKTMDMDDPIMKAMMKKCMSNMDHDVSNKKHKVIDDVDNKVDDHIKHNHNSH